MFVNTLQMHHDWSIERNEIACMIHTSAICSCSFEEVGLQL